LIWEYSFQQVWKWSFNRTARKNSWCFSWYESSSSDACFHFSEKARANQHIAY